MVLDSQRAYLESLEATRKVGKWKTTKNGHFEDSKKVGSSTGFCMRNLQISANPTATALQIARRRNRQKPKATTAQIHSQRVPLDERPRAQTFATCPERNQGAAHWQHHHLGLAHARPLPEQCTRCALGFLLVGFCPFLSILDRTRLSAVAPGIPASIRGRFAQWSAG